MKNLVMIAIVATGFFFTGCSNDDAQAQSLNAEETNDLVTLREEEKLARDVYVYAYDKYNETIFQNISNSEQKHMDKVLSLLNLYNIDDPVLPGSGSFVNAELQTLYNDLTAQVDVSLVEALKVGATIEDLDIRDIEIFENRTSNGTILNVYDKLKCGSRNHMRGFYGELQTLAVTYVPQFITMSELTEIVTSTNEQCGR